MMNCSNDTGVHVLFHIFLLCIIDWLSFTALSKGGGALLQDSHMVVYDNATQWIFFILNDFIKSYFKYKLSKNAVF